MAVRTTPGETMKQGSLKGALRIHPIHTFSDNYVWLIEDGEYAVVVDPGQAQPVLDTLANRDLSLTAILLTHHHQDHVGGVLELLTHFPVPVYGPAMEVLPVCDFSLSEGSTVQLAHPALHLDVLDVPGHTAGHIAFTGQVGDESVLFCGDTLFVAGCGRMFEGTPPQMLASLDKLAALPLNTRVYCAHEYTLSNLRWATHVDPKNAALAEFEQYALARRQAGAPTVPSDIELEKRCNPFLRVREAEIVQAATQWAGKTLSEPAEVFAALREWKNGFK
jgi:hydroxyacylglutathione hydrolase